MEVVVSVATSTLNFAVKTAAKGIAQEFGLLLGVQEELLFIKHEFEMMQAFLGDASTEKMESDVTTTWIQQVKELAMDLEDCLQEASVHLKEKGCLLAMSSVKKRNQIASNIQALKARTSDVINRKLRYNKINNRYGCHTHEEMDNKINKRNGGHKNEEIASTGLSSNVKALLVGLDQAKRNLVDLILKEHLEHRDKPGDGKVISVVGMGGLGKTTLVREVYRCQELRNELQCFAWVTIAHPFNIKKFLESLAKQIPSNSHEVDNKGGTVEGNKIMAELLIKQTLIEMVTEYLQDKKYLIVLDDLCSLSEWVKIKHVLPMILNGSRIIVTTRIRRLAEYISYPSGYIYEMGLLSEEDAFDLFYKVVYKTPNYNLEIDDSELPKEGEYYIYWPTKQTANITISEHMKTQANQIINSCGRQPLSIVTIGSYLATKPRNSVEWKAMHDHLNSELDNNRNLGVATNVLASSYNCMPKQLKPSLLYLSVFHNHKEIRRSRIIRRWMAEELIRGDRKKTLEEIGKEYFYYLMGRSFIEPSQMCTIVNGDVQRCNIHDIMYALILTKAVDESTVSVLEDEDLKTMTGKARHLVITGEACKRNKILARMELSRIRSVSIFGEMGEYLGYPRMKLVKVLDLEDTLNLNNRDLRGVGNLHHLKYLGLRGTKITELPDSLGMLSELETLDIRNTVVVRLPTGLPKLQKLSYLCAGFDLYKNPNINVSGIAHDIFAKCIKFCNNSETRIQLLALMLSLLSLFTDDLHISYGSFGVRSPRGIGKLESLETLGMIDIGRTKSLAKEMQNLTKLRKLAVTGITEENGETLAKVIDGLMYLQSLVLSAANGSALKCCLNYVSSPPKYLQSLKLYSPLGELPDWISSLEMLQKIHFRNTELLTGEIEAIEKLPNLKILYMSYNSLKDLKELCFREYRFRMLQVMILEGLKELESVSIEKTALERLEQLKISKCWSVGQNGVSGLEYLEQLKEMEVVVSKSESDETFVRNLKEKLSMLPQEPVLTVFKTGAPNE